MSKERILSVAFILLIFVFAISNVSAATNSSADKGYDCLEGIIKDKTTSTLSLQEAIFSMLALGKKTVLENEINEDKSSSAECWPKEKCEIKQTAQVALAYKRVNSDTKKIVEWLYTKNSTSNELLWFLEIDSTNHEPSECVLRYDGNDRKVSILEDMTITGNPGNCFTISGSGYFLQFKEACYQKKIEISCDKDFVTTMLYTKKTGDTIYVLPETHSSAALGTTNEQVNVQCFKLDGKCDYEGSLWATLFLHKVGENVNTFVPYLIAMADENTEFFPESFLYTLTGSTDQYSNIIEKQKQGRSWEIVGSPYNELYDTSLAMLALSDSEKENTKSYLLSIQSSNGCWNSNNVRDTAFILYSGWAKSVGGGSGGGTPMCTSVAEQSCEIHNECIDAGGLVLPTFDCTGFNICCSIKVPQKTCQEQEGTICGEGQTCQGTTLDSSEEGLCCSGTCEVVEPSVEDTCTPQGNTCSESCIDGEEQSFDLTCSNSNEICCMQVEKKNYTWLIILLVILIILVILAILFRDKLRFYWYKYKGEASSKPVIKPSIPPSEQPPAQINRPMMQQMPQRTQTIRPRAPPVQKNKEFEETLKKLREMSK